MIPARQHEGWGCRSFLCSPIWWCILTVCIKDCTGILPSAQLDVYPANNQHYTLLASQASFGSIPRMQAKNNPNLRLELPPEHNPLLCETATQGDKDAYADAHQQQGEMGRNGEDSKFLLVVPSGECTSEQKALTAQWLGADAIVIYGTLASRYSVNKTAHEDEKYPEYSTKDIVYPQNLYDYDCAKGRAMIPAPDIRLQPLPYNAPHNDPLLSGTTDDNLCQLYSNDSLRNCNSNMCLLTGNPNHNYNYLQQEDTTTASANQVEACCAWDLHVWLYSDDALVNTTTTVTIPASYITIAQGNQLLKDMKDHAPAYAILSSRYRPEYNSSSMLIWLLGVTVAALAAHLSAGDAQDAIARTLHRRNKRGGRGRTTANTNPAAASETTTTTTTSNTVLSRGRSSSSSPTTVLDHDIALPTTTNTSSQQRPFVTTQEESLELNGTHAIGFVIMASSGLLILFFFKIYSFVKVMYAFGCSSAVMQVLFQPLCRKIARRFHFRDYIVWRTGTADFGDITYLDIVAGILGYSLGFTWLYVAFFVRNADTLPFYWIVQDIMGTCMCIVFLTLIKLNSMRVAAILLFVAFLYDIFFVFVTPLLFQGKSVMITVATSGGPPKADPSWCEKYPDDADCQGGDPLPMLLTIPRLGDYQGGASLLGLGDIVLPGLLLSFAARIDAAKSLVGIVGGGNGAVTSHSCPERRFCWSCGFCSGGYFPPLIVAYAVGLLMANMAVYLMEMGQPALLYLVPCTLGTLAFMGWRRNELMSLWEGPRVLYAADQILYGISPPSQQQQQQQQQQASLSGGMENGTTDRNEQEEEENDPEEHGNVPLLSHDSGNP